MNDEWYLVLIPLSVVWGIVTIVRVVTESTARQKAIEKGLPEDVARTLFARAVAIGDQSLKYGMVAGALGLSLMILDGRGVDLDRPLAFGIPLFFVGVALVAYHVFAGGERKKKAQE